MVKYNSSIHKAVANNIANIFFLLEAGVMTHLLSQKYKLSNLTES